MAAQTDDFRTTYRRLKSERRPGVSLEDIYFEARQRMEADGHEAASLSSVQKAVAPGSGRYPSLDVLETVAVGLGVDPEEFADYRLALARASLDAEEVGWENALANLEDYERSGPSPAEVRKVRDAVFAAAQKDTRRNARSRRRRKG